MYSKKIAFIKNGSFSHLNEYFLEALRSTFPDREIKVFDITKDLLNSQIHYINYLYVIKEYGLEILLFKRKFAHCKLRTTYVFRKVKEAVARKISVNEFTFSLQTQSVFDSSVAGLPHFIYTDHTHLANLYYPSFNSKKLFSKTWIELEKSAYHNAKMVFTMSTNISRSVIEQYECSPEKVRCIHAGYNAQGWRQKENEDKYKSKIILFVGIDWERKGGPVLIDAFKKVLRVHPDSLLHIVGCSPEIDCPSCKVVGRIAIEKVASYYRESAVFCLPTTIEPFGVVFLEAAAYKLPVVATKIGAIPDLVEDGNNGYLVAPGDSDALAEKLIELLNSPQQCQLMGSNNFTRNSNIYNWDAVARTFRNTVEVALR